MTTYNNINIYSNPYEVALSLSSCLAELACSASPERRLNIAIPGGNTPQLLYSLLKSRFGNAPWERINFFFTDERLVPVDSPQSNYGQFLRNVGIDAEKKFNLFPYIYPHNILRDNATIVEEMSRAKSELLIKIKKNIPFTNNLPNFDYIILGIGADGHTASVFVDNLKSFNSNEAIEYVVNPNDGTNRITLTGSTINNAKQIIFLCTGAEKSNVVKEVFFQLNTNLPATNVMSAENIKWFIDNDAFAQIKSNI